MGLVFWTLITCFGMGFAVFWYLCAFCLDSKVVKFNPKQIWFVYYENLVFLFQLILFGFQTIIFLRMKLFGVFLYILSLVLRCCVCSFDRIYLASISRSYMNKLYIMCATVHSSEIKPILLGGIQKENHKIINTSEIKPVTICNIIF